MTANAHRLFAVLAGSLLVAACSSSEPVESNSSLSVGTVESTESTPSSEVPPTEPETTEATTTLPTTAPTEEVTTTTVAGTPEEEVTAAVTFFEEQWKDCLRTLPNCDTQAVIERRIGDEISTIQANAILWNQNDYRASNIDALEYRVDDVVIDTAQGTAVVTLCVTDPVSLTESDGATVVDNNFYSSIQEWRMATVDGEWGVAERMVVGDTSVGEASNICAD